MSTSELLSPFPQPLAPMPLVVSDEGRFQNIPDPGRRQFHSAAQPAEAHACWLLYAGYGSASHSIAQDLKSREGVYLHALYHRMEPDNWNSKYWFRQLGSHPLFPELANCAQTIGWECRNGWDAARFVDFASEARESNHQRNIALAEQVQFAEWSLLFEYCVKGGAR